jgi:hypothetical protein
MSNEKFNAQRFLELASEEGLINLNISLKEVVSSKSASYFNSVADEGDIIICPDFLWWKGPIPHRGDVFGNLQLANSLRESLKVSNELLQKIGGELSH